VSHCFYLTDIAGLGCVEIPLLCLLRGLPQSQTILPKDDSMKDTY